jgi:hypothetical protein
VVTSLS